jgi:drug/metabolite transporter (DMT)-like permease
MGTRDVPGPGCWLDSHHVKSSSQARAGILFAIAAAALFAVNGNVSKLALLNGISSLELVSMRSAGTALVLLGITALTNPASLRCRPRELGFLALYGLSGIAMVQWLYFVALQRMPVGIALLFEYTAPLMVALWVRFVQKQPVKSRLWLGLACALGGLALVAQFWKGLMGFSFGFSAILWAIVSPWQDFPFARLTESVDLPGALPGGAPLWLMVVWIIVLGSVAPFLFVLLAVARLGPARVGLIGMLEPVGAGIIAWILLGESLNAVQIGGTVIVLVGIVLAETARQTARPASDQPHGPLGSQTSARPAEGVSPLPEGMAP